MRTAMKWLAKAVHDAAASVQVVVCILATVMLCATARGQFCSAPTNVSATSACSQNVQVSWTAPSGSVLRYRVYVSTTPGQPGTLYYTVNAPATTFLDPLPAFNITKYYTVAAEWPFCVSAGVEVSGIMRRTPEPPQVSTAFSCSGIQVTWNATLGATSYAVWREEPQFPGFFYDLGTTTGTTFTDTTAPPYGLVKYGVRAINQCGTSPLSPLSQVLNDGAQGPTPNAPVIVSATCSGITVQGVGSSVNWVSGPLQIFRRVNNTDTLVGQVSVASTIVDSGAPAGVSVQYFSRMTHPCQISPPSALSAPVTRPGPSPVAATVTATDGTSCTDVRISFTFPPQPDVTSVEILRATVNAISQASVLGTFFTSNGSGSWTDATAAPEQTYWYWVRRTAACSAVLSNADSGWRGRSVSLIQFTQQPASTTACLGDTVTFSVSTTGGRVGGYRWSLNNTLIDPVENPTALTPNLVVSVDAVAKFGDYRCRIETCNVRFSSIATLTQQAVCCDSLDFNNNGVFPEDQDLVDMLFVLAGGECAACNDLDFNNNGVFPEDQDVADYLNVLAGGTCQ